MESIHTLISVATIVVGLVCFIAPTTIVKFLGLTITNMNGLIEIRSIYGGTFIGIGVMALVLNDPLAYTTLGGALLGIGFARLVSMIMAKTVVQLNVITISLIIEIVAGILLIIR